MVTQLFLLVTTLTVGAMAQTTSIMGLFLDTAEEPNATMVGSVIHAVPDATTYAISRLPDANCPWTPTEACGDSPGPSRTYVNGPSTFARRLTLADGFIWNIECDLNGEDANCVTTITDPPAAPKSENIDYYRWDTSNVNPVTITAGLEKLLSQSPATTSSSAQMTPSASSGPPVTDDSASATSSSSSTPTPSTAANSGATATARDIVLAAFGGMVALALRL